MNAQWCATASASVSKATKRFIECGPLNERIHFPSASSPTFVTLVPAGASAMYFDATGGAKCSRVVKCW